MNKLKLFWKKLWESYNSHESALILMGGGMVYFLDGNVYGAVTFFAFAALVRVPAFIRWISAELKSEEEIQNIKLNAHTLSVEFGDVYVFYKDENNKVLLKEKVDKALMNSIRSVVGADNLKYPPPPV